jgi:DNA-binding MarR family transcriptional regulator
MVNLIYTSNWIADSQMRLLKPFDLTLQQYNVLRILRGQHPSPVKVSDITERHARQDVECLTAGR